MYQITIAIVINPRRELDKATGGLSGLWQNQHCYLETQKNEKNLIQNAQNHNVVTF